MADFAVLAHEDLDALIAAIAKRGYQIVGPTVRDEAVRYGTIESSADLPRGWVDQQSGGTYRLAPGDGDSFFSVVHGPDTPKTLLFPASETLFRVQTGSPTRFIASEPDDRPLAFLGLRPCDLAAVAVQDQVLTAGEFVDPAYAARRGQALFIPVNCTRSVSTCFCSSMDTGPRATGGFDLALTEVSGDASYFLVEVGTDIGQALLDEVSTRPASAAEVSVAVDQVDACEATMVKTLDTDGIKDLLYANLDNQQWDNVADRCLACGNCTLVCPTCFCTTPVDSSSLDGRTAERSRIWASCFSLDYSYMGGNPVRSSISSRYRQWMTHKLATWIDQFGSSGCVGCGRCIAWCPVGIDLTEEVRAMRDTDMRVTV